MTNTGFIWENRNTCWLSKNPQGSKAWCDLREAAINSSMITNYIGKSKFSNSPTENALISCGVHEKSFKYSEEKRMEVGIAGEKHFRNWYQNELKKKYGSSYEVNEVGIGVWKKNPIFRGSLDGEVDEDLCVEFKIPEHMPYSLIKHVEDVKNGKKFDTFYHDHIKRDNYDQMQCNMVIHDKKFCDYLVYAHNDKTIYYERVPINEEYFYKELYYQAIDYYETYVIPLMEKLNIQRIDF